MPAQTARCNIDLKSQEKIDEEQNKLWKVEAEFWGNTQVIGTDWSCPIGSQECPRRLADD